MTSLLQRIYPEVSAGGFSRIDGTIQFFIRVNALVEPGMTVLDIGAGRGATAETNAATRWLYSLRGKVRKVIGLDVDDAVHSNPFLDEATTYDGGRIPFEDASMDLIVSDHTFEHIRHPEVFASEINRVLKPGGWLCARTPHFYSLLYVASLLVPNASHARVLQRVQPTRKAEDVFPTFYKLNSRRAIERHFPPASWQHCSYTFSPEPGYHFGNRIVFELLRAYQYLKQPLLGGEVLLIFLRKR